MYSIIGRFFLEHVRNPQYFAHAIIRSLCRRLGNQLCTRSAAGQYLKGCAICGIYDHRRATAARCFAHIEKHHETRRHTANFVQFVAVGVRASFKLPHPATIFRLLTGLRQAVEVLGGVGCRGVLYFAGLA